MQKGKVKWFDLTKGYGFIKPDNGEKDVFVHISQVESSGYNELLPDQVVNYDIENKNDKSVAINIKLV